MGGRIGRIVNQEEHVAAPGHQLVGTNVVANQSRCSQRWVRNILHKRCEVSVGVTTHLHGSKSCQNSCRYRDVPVHTSLLRVRVQAAFVITKVLADWQLILRLIQLVEGSA